MPQPILRSQIPSQNVSGTTNIVMIAGYAAAGDYASGDIYTSVGASSGSLMAIQDSAGTWFRLVTSGKVKINSFGAKGDGSTDDVAAFLLFRTWALAFNASTPNAGIVLDFAPNAQYICSNGYVFTGINNLTVNGNNASLKNTNGNFNDSYISYWLGGYGYSNFTPPTAITCGLTINNTAYPIATANPGDTSVTCLTHANATNMVAGNWALIASHTGYPGNPPGMRYFDYVRVLTVNGSTGVVTFDRPVVNKHLSTLPTHSSAGVLFAAFIFPFLAIFGVKQKYRDLNVLPSPTSPTNNYIFMQGESCVIEGGHFSGGVDPSQLINGWVNGARIDGVSAGGFEIDHWVNSFAFRDCNMGTIFDVNTSGQSIEITNCEGPGMTQSGSSLRVKGCSFGSFTFNKCIYGTFDNNYPCVVTAWPTSSMSELVIDGATITYSAGVITIPQGQFTVGSVNSVTQFIIDIWTGAILDIVQHTSGFTNTTGGFMKVLSITDDVTNIYLTCDVFSLTVTAAVVHSGSAGTNYAVGNTIVLSNGVILTVATLSGSAVATVTITQGIAQRQNISAVAQVSTSGSGSGATFDLTYGIPNGTILAAPIMVGYSGRNNIGGDNVAFTATDQVARSVNAFPNGDLKTVNGNKRTALIAPVSGGTIYYASQTCRGYLKQITVNVIRPYTGAQYSVNTLFLCINGYLPDQFYPLVTINLSIPGLRTITPTGIVGNKTADTAVAGYETGMDLTYTSAYTINIGPTVGSNPTFTDATGLLPIIELDIEFEDIAHSIPW